MVGLFGQLKTTCHFLVMLNSVILFYAPFKSQAFSKLNAQTYMNT